MPFFAITANALRRRRSANSIQLNKNGGTDEDNSDVSVPLPFRLRSSVPLVQVRFPRSWSWLICLVSLLVSSTNGALFGGEAAATAATWHVAVDGNDSAPGTLDRPFASITRAQQAVNPGDTVLMRGGTYRMTETQIAEKKDIYARIFALSKSGTPGKRITYRAYTGEEPIFDCTQVKPELRIVAFYVSASWIHLEGLTVTGVQVVIKEHTQSICFENQGSNNVYERLRMHHGQAIGIYSVRGSDNLFLNCDAWANWDFTSENGKGGNVDGFGCHPPKGSTGNVFRGCRAWCNSDDGYDLINAHESVTFENCWAMTNGQSESGEKLGDGNGFKAGGYGTLAAERLPNPIPRHVVRGCLAVRNRASGFYANHHPGGGDWFNNSGFRNGTNYNMLCRLRDNRTDVPGFSHRLRNNLSFGSRNHLAQFEAGKNEEDHNSFAPDLTLTEGDFVSLDDAQVFAPRAADGGLPVITFLHLAEGSALIDAGVDVGLPFRGAKPDLGAFER